MSALIMASRYGRLDVAGLLLDHGVPADAPAPGDGSTPLHGAAYEGHPELVDLLLRHGARVDVRDERYRTPPLVWALHAWLVAGHGDAARHPASGVSPPYDARYREVLHLLLDAGAEVKEDWLGDERLRTDPTLWTALLAAAQRGVQARPGQ